MDSYDKKSSGKDVSVKSIKCNNVNVNVNGLELNVLPPSLANLLQGDEGDNGASSYGSNGYGNGGSYGGQSGYDNSFKFVCINNNNNTVVVENRTTPIPPIEDECAEDIEACFEEFLSDERFLALETALESQAGLSVEIAGEEVTLRSFADICEALEGLTTYQELQDAISAILSAIGQRLTPFVLIDCIAEVLDIPIPPRMA